MRRARRTGGLLAVCCVAAVSIVLSPVTSAAADGTGTRSTVDPTQLAPTADTYVVREAPGQGYGSAGKVAASNWTTWHSEAYLGFTVPAAPAGTTIAEARLDLTFQRLDKQPAAVEFYAVTGAWTEATTYDTRPALGGLVATAPVAAQGTQRLSVDVTAAVRPTGGAHSFAVVNPTAESAAVFNSREQGADAPRLTIRYGADPAMLCGASFMSELPNESYQEAYERVNALYGGLDLTRVFYGGLPAGWPGKLNTGGRPMIISFKAQPSDILAGRHDAYLRTWFQNAPRDRDIYWTYYHEPEDNIRANEFTAPDYRAAWQRVSGLADEAANPRLRATLILMGWTLDPRSGRNWRDYYPGRAAIDVLAWDNYNDAVRDNVYATPQEIFGRAVETSRAEGLPFGVAETGSGLIAGDTGAGRAAWLRGIISYLDNAGAVFLAYFDLDWRPHGSVDFRLRDAASTAAWRDFCTRT